MIETIKLNGKGKPIIALPRLSPSSINSWNKCPREFYYNYILKAKVVPNIHLIKGSLVHQVLENFFKEYHTDGKNWLLNEFVTEWVKQKLPIAQLEMPEDELLVHKKDAFRMIMDYYTVHTRKLTALIEFGKAESERHAFFLLKPKFRELWVESSELKCAGYIDRVDVDYNDIMTLGDYKTSSKFGIGLSEDYKRQLSIYALLYEEVKGRLPDFVSIIFLRYGEEFLLEVTPSLLKYARDSIQHVWNNTRSTALIDYPRKEGKLCRWCSFRPLCSGKAKADEKKRKEEIKKAIVGETHE